MSWPWPWPVANCESTNNRSSRPRRYHAGDLIRTWMDPKLELMDWSIFPLAFHATDISLSMNARSTLCDRYWWSCICMGVFSVEMSWQGIDELQSHHHELSVAYILANYCKANWVSTGHFKMTLKTSDVTSTSVQQIFILPPVDTSIFRHYFESEGVVYLDDLNPSEFFPCFKWTCKNSSI
jgi:hypothetical protein